MRFQINEDGVIRTNYGNNKIEELYNLFKENGIEALSNIQVIGYYDRKEYKDEIIDIIPHEVDRTGLVFGRLSNIRDMEMVYDITEILGSDQLLVVDGDTYKPQYISAGNISVGQKISSLNGALEVHEKRNLNKGLCYDLITKNNIPSIYSDKLLLVADMTIEEVKSFLKHYT
jgi:hypothetical protein